MSNPRCSTDNPAGNPQRRWCRVELVAEVRLLSVGDHLESIAGRLGMNPRSLERALIRADELELLARITPLSLRDRRETAA